MHRPHASRVVDAVCRVVDDDLDAAVDLVHDGARALVRGLQRKDGGKAHLSGAGDARAQHVDGALHAEGRQSRLVLEARDPEASASTALLVAPACARVARRARGAALAVDAQLAGVAVAGTLARAVGSKRRALLLDGLRQQRLQCAVQQGYP